jgi:hypothetical protein
VYEDSVKKDSAVVHPELEFDAQDYWYVKVEIAEGQAYYYQDIR